MVSVNKTNLVSLLINYKYTRKKEEIIEYTRLAQPSPIIFFSDSKYFCYPLNVNPNLMNDKFVSPEGILMR